MRVEHLQPPRAGTVCVWDQTVCQNWFSQQYPCVGRNSGSSPFQLTLSVAGNRRDEMTPPSPPKALGQV